MSNVYHAPKNRKKIKEIYVVLSEDNTGEGIVNASINGMGFQLICGYPETLEKISIVAKQLSHDTGCKLKLYKFTNKELIEEI